MQRVIYQISLKDEREIHQKIGGEVGNLERTNDGTNKMRDMSKRPN